jgi:hypothetical protein
VACACGYGDEPSGSIICGEFLDNCRPVSFSRRTLLYGVSNLSLVEIGQNVGHFT